MVMRCTQDLRPALLMYRCRAPPSEYLPGSLRALARVADSAIESPPPPPARRGVPTYVTTLEMGYRGKHAARLGTEKRLSAMKTRASGTIWDREGMVSGGAGGTRTPYLFNAIEALSQMSYSPTHAGGLFGHYVVDYTRAFSDLARSSRWEGTPSDDNDRAPGDGETARHRTIRDS